MERFASVDSEEDCCCERDLSDKEGRGEYPSSGLCHW